MTLSERVNYFENLFYDLQETSSLNMKRAIVDELPNELQEDFEYILECLAGKYVFGYKFETLGTIHNYGDVRNENNTIKDVLEFLLEPNRQKDLSRENIARHVSQVSRWYDFFASIVDKTLKLGIGKSLLPCDGLSVMLAKKYEGKVKDSRDGYFITEKLDGNRCVAHYDGLKWVFTSRNGKPMHVDFDMSGLPKEYVYDGEILSPQQVQLSKAIYDHIKHGKNMELQKGISFNETSGLINRHDKNKQLVYNIFDIMYDGVSYISRREVLNTLKPNDEDVRILPTLAYTCDKNTLSYIVGDIMNCIVSAGGEGAMVNIADSKYMHKRTDGLLKVKPVYSIDMLVTDVEYGSGKYFGQVGAIHCIAKQDDKIIQCRVGSGLTDEQRFNWSINKNDIVGKIVEIGYFSLSQDEYSKGTVMYSLRFPRLIKIRKDKNETSIY